ncbi:MAG: hypothetical protein ACREU2_16680 [Steroidobacteraceae bacterium]
MSGEAPIIRELIGFDGAVECEQQAQGTTLHLRGAVRAGINSDNTNSGGSNSGNSHCARAEVWFSGVSFSDTRADVPRVPVVLQRVNVLELAVGAASRRAFRIDAAAGSFELQAGSVQVHREVARAFFGAVPPVRVPLATRLGWMLLLGLLRLPGAARLLAKLRS